MKTNLRIGPGDRSTLYTDGFLEARAESGEVFSFERLQALFASPADTVTASAAAVGFGQARRYHRAETDSIFQCVMRRAQTHSSPGLATIIPKTGIDEGTANRLH